jgi:dTDP-4-amino-4,6-dideoxygalactose transaminase
MEVLSLPMHPHLSLEEVAHVAASIVEFSESAE